MSEQTFDVIVVGGGPAGTVAAGRLADAGLSVALVERQLVGGECSYWGCIPSKTLLRPGDVLAAARRVPGAVEAVTGTLSVASAFGQRDYMVSGYSDEGQERWLRDEGIALFRGRGRLAGERAVEVLDEDRTGGEPVRTSITAHRAVVLATGSSALLPPIPGLASAHPWDNRSATGAKEVPARLLILGGGAIGAEMAQAFARFGSRVTVVDAAPRLLSREEPFAGDEVREAFDREGIEVRTEARVTEVSRPVVDGPVSAVLDDGTMLVADELLVGVGRRPRTEDLGLEAVGLSPGRPVEVDDLLRAKGVPGDWLYAIGDVNGRALLTHMGKYQARIAADVILGKPARDRSSGDIVPRVTFTDPQVAAVGLTEAQARDRFASIRTVSYGVGAVAGSYVRGEGIGGTAQLVVDESRRVLVGATFTGPDVQELVHAAAIAIVGRVTVDDLWHAVPSFPTVSEVWLRLLEEYGL